MTDNITFSFVSVVCIVIPQVADITFTFWNHLSEVLYDLGRGETSQLFSPYIQRLIIALARHCQFDSTMVC